MKKIFCIERSVTRDPVTGQSKELEQAIEIALYASTLLDSSKPVEGLMNVLLSAPEQPTFFNQSLQRCLPSFCYIENHMKMLEYLYKWLGLKCEFMFKRGVTMSDFEELRTIGLQFINNRTTAQMKSMII